MPKDRKIFKERLLLGSKYGFQLGNYLQWAIAAGLKFGTKSAVNSNNYLTLDPSQVVNPFFSINPEFGFGILLPKPTLQGIDKCEILNCEKRKVSLLKVSSTNSLYFDRFMSRINGKVAYERKLGLTPFSINVSVAANYKSFRHFAISNIRDTLVYENVIFQNSTWSDRPKVDSYDIQYENSIVKNARINLAASTQLRYYMLQHKKLKNGLKSNNLNDIYMLAECIKNQDTSILKSNTLRDIKGTINTMLYGLGIGFQTQSSRNTYIDLSFGYGLSIENSKFLNDLRVGYRNPTAWATAEFGLAR
jgi:hypothetical protein